MKATGIRRTDFGRTGPLERLAPSVSPSRPTVTAEWSERADLDGILRSPRSVPRQNW